MEAAPLHHHHHHHHHHRRLSDEKLASQLAAFGLLGRTNHVAPSTPVKKASSPPASFPVRTEVPKRGYYAGFMPFAQFPPFNPIFVEGQGLKGWVFQSELGRVRFIPVRSSTGPGQQNGGTGVFLPRVAVREEVNKTYSSKGREQKKPQQPQQKPSPISSPLISSPPPEHGQVGTTFHSPSVAELVSLLPQEWSY